MEATNLNAYQVLLILISTHGDAETPVMCPASVALNGWMSGHSQWQGQD